jgi:hypothetical protein
MLNTKQIDAIISSYDKLLTKNYKAIQKSLNFDVSLKDIKDIIDQLESSQIHKQYKQDKNYRPIVSQYPLQDIQADLLDIQDRSKVNGNSFLFNIIDVYSRKAWSYPIKRKSALEMETAFKQFLNKTKFNGRIFTDEGKEFLNRNMKDLYKINNIEHITIDSENHRQLGIIERFHLTLREKLRLLEERTGNKQFISRLQDMIDGYNDTQHRTIKQTPNDVFNGKAKPAERKPYITKIKFSLGDRVRYLMRKRTTKLFEKGPLRYSKLIAEIVGMDHNKYVLSNGIKRFPEDLQLVKTVIKDSNKKDSNKKIINKVNRERAKLMQLSKKEYVQDDNELSTLIKSVNTKRTLRNR